MSTEIAALVSAIGSSAGAGATGATATPASAQAGYGVSLSDISGFQNAMSKLEARGPTDGVEAVRQLMKPFEHINAEASRLAADANAARAAGNDMTPGEVVMLTVRSQEFMFHCQLTSNIANRTSEGLQQLFKQQG